MASGRILPGPCGHPHEVVIGTFAVCTLKGCDGLPGERCRRCQSSDLYDFEAPLTPPGSKACKRCGAVRWSGFPLDGSD